MPAGKIAAIILFFSLSLSLTPALARAFIISSLVLFVLAIRPKYKDVDSILSEETTVSIQPVIQFTHFNQMAHTPLRVAPVFLEYDILSKA